MGLCVERMSGRWCSSPSFLLLLVFFIASVHSIGKPKKISHLFNQPLMDKKDIFLTTSPADTGWHFLQLLTDGKRSSGQPDGKKSDRGQQVKKRLESYAENEARSSALTTEKGSEIINVVKTHIKDNQSALSRRNIRNNFFPFSEKLDKRFSQKSFKALQYDNSINRKRRSLYYGLKIGAFPYRFLNEKRENRQKKTPIRRRERQENGQHQQHDERQYDRQTEQTSDLIQGKYKSTTENDDVLPLDSPKEELTAQESQSSPVFVTIVQRHKEADYFVDKHPAYHPPEYHAHPLPSVYHEEPGYHAPLPLPPLPPPHKYPEPEHYPPPPPPDYYHYAKESKYYHASDYNEPSYHKPHFYHEIKYVKEPEHYPPPLPLPYPRHEKGYIYSPPVYHTKSYHETKVHHDYVPPPPPPPPKGYHEPVLTHESYHHAIEYHPPKPEYLPPKPEYLPPKPEYLPPKLEYHPPKPEYHPPEPEYHHPVPATYGYHVNIYDRKDDYEPEYYDPPKSHYPAYVEPITEVKHEYIKGSNIFEHGVDKLPPVHIVGDNLYDPVPPHGFIKAKYEKPAPYHQPPHHHRYNKGHSPSKTSSYHTLHNKKSVPIPHPLPPPSELLADKYEVPLPAPLPSLEDVDPLIFEPILPYNEYFEAATEIAVGDIFNVDTFSTPLPREYPFKFDLDAQNHYTSQIPIAHPPNSYTVTPSYSYQPLTFPAEEEEKEEEDQSPRELTTIPISSTPELQTPIDIDPPISLSSTTTASSTPATTSRSPTVEEVPSTTEMSIGNNSTTSTRILIFPGNNLTTPMEPSIEMTQTEETVDVTELFDITTELTNTNPITNTTTPMTTALISSSATTMPSLVTDSNNSSDVPVSNSGLTTVLEGQLPTISTTVSQLTTNSSVTGDSDESKFSNNSELVQQTKRPTSIQKLQKLRIMNQTSKDIFQALLQTRSPTLQFSLPSSSEISTKDKRKLSQFFFPNSPRVTDKISTETQQLRSDYKKEKETNASTGFRPTVAPQKIVSNTSIIFPDDDDVNIDDGLLQPTDLNSTSNAQDSAEVTQISNMYGSNPSMYTPKPVQLNMYGTQGGTQNLNMYGSGIPDSLRPPPRLNMYGTNGNAQNLNMYGSGAPSSAQPQKLNMYGSNLRNNRPNRNFQKSRPPNSRNRKNFIWRTFGRRSNKASLEIHNKRSLPMHFQL